MAASLLRSAAPTPTSCRRSSHRTPCSPPYPYPLMLLPPRTPKPPSLRLNSPWTGLRLQLQPTHRNTEKKRPCRGGGARASLFGVGAPEALVIGVVALLVFGPKGLAEVARNLGKTLRTFQPTIRELQEVSREFKSTLEQEIGLNDVTSSLNSTYKPTSFPNEIKQAGVDTNGVPTKPYTSEDLLKVTEEQIAASGAKSQTQDGVPTKPYTSEDLLKVTEEQIAASRAKSQTQEAPTTPEIMAATSEIRTSAASTEPTVTPEVPTAAAAAASLEKTFASTEPTVTPETQTSAAASEIAAQTSSSEKAENEKL